MDPIYIRSMNEQDIPGAALVMAKAFNTSALHSEQQLAEISAKGKLCKAFVATRADKVIGLAICERKGNTPQNPGLTIELLAVDKDQRSKGIGGGLMRHTERFIQHQWLDGKPADVLIEDLTKRGNPMSRYYEKMGYQEWFGRSDNDMPLLYKTLKPPAPKTP